MLFDQIHAAAHSIDHDLLCRQRERKGYIPNRCVFPLRGRRLRGGGALCALPPKKRGPPDQVRG